MSRKTSEKQKLSGPVSNLPGIAVPLTVDVRGVGAAGEAVAKALDADRSAVAGSGDAQARVMVTDSAGLVKAARVAGEAADGAKTWIALLTDHSTDALEGQGLDEFEQVLDELEPGVVDLVLLVDSAQAGELIAAWATAKAEAPASVLSRLPDSEGSACHYVALTGIRVAGGGGGGVGEAGDIADYDVRSGPALRESMREFVRDNADGVREARAKVAAAVEAGSASQALSASAALDGAIDGLQEQSLEGLDVQVSKFVASGSDLVGAEESGGEGKSDEESVDDSEPVRAATTDVDLDALGKARTAALSEFLLAASKGGLGKLFAKAKLKQAGDSLLKTTDAYVEGQGAQLIDELTELAEPLVDTLHQDQLRQSAALNSAELVQQALQAAADIKPLALASPAKINRSWTAGAPAPRKYLLASNLTFDTAAADLDFDADVSAVPVSEFDGAYIIQAQYALSKTALAS